VVQDNGLVAMELVRKIEAEPEMVEEEAMMEEPG